MTIQFELLSARREFIVIEEAKYWQDDLKKIATKLEHRYRQKRWTIKSQHSVEKEIFLSFFIIRKLIESERLLPPLTDRNIKLTKYARKGTENISTNPKKFHEQYDLTKGKDCQLSPREFSNQLVHSYIFSPFVPWGREMVGMFFYSDKTKEHSLYYITLAKIIEIIISVGTGDLKEVKVVIEPNSSVIRTVIK